MSILRGFLTVSFFCAFAASVFAAPNRAAGPQGLGGGASIVGTVVQVHHDLANPSTGWIRLHRWNHSGRGRGQAMTVAVNAATRFQRQGQRGRGNSLATFRALHRGERVRVLLASGLKGVARVVEILPNTSYRSRNRYAWGFRHRPYYTRHHTYHRLPQINRGIVAPTVKQNIKPVVKHEVKYHRPAPPRHNLPHPVHPRSTGHSRPPAHHRK